MKTLSTKKIDRWYYVKDGILFKMGYIADKDDKCVIVNPPIPRLRVSSLSSGEEITYYLDSLMECGDKYVQPSAEIKSSFVKTLHGKTAESEMGFDAYYKLLCEDEIKKNIQVNYNKDYEWFNEDISRLGVPDYMISGHGWTVIGSNIQINFTEEYFNTTKHEIAEKEAYTAAENMAKIYGYQLKNNGTVNRTAEKIQCELNP